MIFKSKQTEKQKRKNWGFEFRYLLAVKQDGPISFYLCATKSLISVQMNIPHLYSAIKNMIFH
jgi:hypothetical protein